MKTAAAEEEREKKKPLKKRGKKYRRELRRDPRKEQVLPRAELVFPLSPSGKIHSALSPAKDFLSSKQSLRKHKFRAKNISKQSLRR